MRRPHARRQPARTRDAGAGGRRTARCSRSSARRRSSSGSAHDPKIGIGEAYMAGDWRAGPDTDLADLLLPFAERLTDLVPPALHGSGASSTAAIPHGPARTRSTGSRRNIEAALRPEQRPVRGVPRRDADLQLRAVRRHRAVVGAEPRGGAAAQGRRRSSTWPGSAPGPGCWRSAPAGARSRSRPPGAVRRVTTLTLSAEQAGAGQAAGRRGRARRPRRHPAAGLPRGRRQLRRDRQRRDDRGGRRGVLADVLRDPRPAARARRRRRRSRRS